MSHLTEQGKRSRAARNVSGQAWTHPRPVHKRDGFKAWILLTISTAATFGWLAYMVATMT